MQGGGQSGEPYGAPVVSQGEGSPSHFESYADAAVKSNACALPSRVGFQTRRSVLLLKGEH